MNLIGQIVEMNYVAHHPNRLVERTEFVISIPAMQNRHQDDYLIMNKPITLNQNDRSYKLGLTA